MSKTIADYTAAVAIDATNDYLLIEPSGNTVYKKINRNTLLGITGSPLGTSDTQNITNKTLDNTNTVTLKDTLFTLQNAADTSKQAKFQLSGITTATTRTYTLPNASSTLADIATAQTFTNKTLTSPTITGGTIDNSTITVDSISGHTSGTIVTVANLQISNGVLNTANSVTATAIAASAVQPQALFTGTGSSWAWQSWTPTWTNVTTTNSTTTAKYTQIGKTVIFRLILKGGAATALGTDPQFSLPVTATNYGSASTGVPIIGLIRFEDNGVANYMGRLALLSTTVALLQVENSASTYVALVGVTAAVPFAFGNGDEIMVTGTYEAA